MGKILGDLRRAVLAEAVDTVDGRRRAAEAEVERLKGVVATQDEAATKLWDTVNRQQAELRLLRAALDADTPNAGLELDHARRHIATLTAERAELREKVTEAAQLLAQHETWLSNVRGELTQAEARYTAERDRRVHLRQRVDAYERQVSELREQLRGQEAEAERVIEQRDEAWREVERLRELAHGHLTEVEQLKQKLADTELQRVEALRLRNQLGEQAQEFRRQLDAQWEPARLQEVEAERSQLAGELEGARSAFDRASRRATTYAAEVERLRRLADERAETIERLEGELELTGTPRKEVWRGYANEVDGETLHAALKTHGVGVNDLLSLSLVLRRP